jgi:hypothetical protein
MNHMDLSEELRNQLLESAAWGKAGIAPSRLDESSQEVEEVIEEEEDLHVCPLCTSQLSEAIDEESLLEHLDVVLSLVDRLSQLNEGDEDIESVIDETIANALFGEDE